MMLKAKLAQASSQDKDIANESASKVDLSTTVGQTIAKKQTIKVLKKSYSTVEVIYTTDVLKH